MSKLKTEIEEDEDVRLYLELADLKRRKTGLRALFQVKDKMSIEPTEPEVLDSIVKKVKPIIENLATKYHCDEREILIAFDEAQPGGKKIDDYLRKKINKLSKDDMDGFLKRKALNSLRANVLQNGKLNPEIRMSQNCILPVYGAVSILIGGDASKVSTVVINKERFHFTEAVMSSPIEGEDFYTINLQNTANLLILGPREVLEKHKEFYKDKIVYSDELSDSHRRALYVTSY